MWDILYFYKDLLLWLDSLTPPPLPPTPTPSPTPTVTPTPTPTPTPTLAPIIPADAWFDGNRWVLGSEVEIPLG